MELHQVPYSSMNSSSCKCSTTSTSHSSELEENASTTSASIDFIDVTKSKCTLFRKRRLYSILTLILLLNFTFFGKIIFEMLLFVFSLIGNFRNFTLKLHPCMQAARLICVHRRPVLDRRNSLQKGGNFSLLRSVYIEVALRKKKNTINNFSLRLLHRAIRLWRFQILHSFTCRCYVTVGYY